MSVPPLPGAAEVVIVGGGVAGCSVAYHLARAGWRDVVLLDKGELTSGSTHHAAGLVTQFNPSATMMGFRRYSVDLYNELGVFTTVGSVRIASSRESLRDLQRAVSRAAALGLDAELIGPAEVVERLPFASRESLYGGVWMAGEYHGVLNPREYARARLWSMMSMYGWSLWGSIRIGTTGDPEIRDWAASLWQRAVAEFASPELEWLLADAGS